MSQPDLHSEMNEFKKYFEMQKRYSVIRESEHEKAKQHEQESRMQAQLSQWQEAVEELAKVEAMLAKLIAHETGWHVPQKHGAMLNWPGRLDTIIGELGRYRETLMRRVADGLLPRLTQDANKQETEGPQTASGIASRLQAAIGKPLV